MALITQFPLVLLLRNAQHEAAADKTIVSCCGDLWIILAGMFGVSARRSPSQTDTSPHVATNTPSGHKDAILSDEQSRGCRSKPSPFLFLFFSLPSLCYSRLGDYDRPGNTLYQETIHRVERVSPFCVTRSDRKQMKSFKFFLVSGNQSMRTGVRLARIMWRSV